MTFQAPKGTRDLYPEDVARQRYITKAWRDTSIRFGFEEIEGPTFESSELYAVKSGEGILGELFQAFSGKDEAEVEEVRASGRAPYALRPEFTPTLARMYAARARQLTKPTKWFTAGPYFRAEKPQRGRLREFQQWNVDYLGLATESADNVDRARAEADAETAGVCIALLHSLGLSQKDVELQIGDRRFLNALARNSGISADRFQVMMWAKDNQGKIPSDVLEQHLKNAGVTRDDITLFAEFIERATQLMMSAGVSPQKATELGIDHSLKDSAVEVLRALNTLGYNGWWRFESGIVRGLAYYTGTVFEIIAEGERAVCGGGRYDKLVELFGGPPTPAVGFGMGDVVLGLLLEDKGLMPTGRELYDAISRPPASVRPEAFVISGNDETNDDDVRRLVARLRHGPEPETILGDGRSVADMKPWERPAGLHARHSYKSTRNVGKLLKDAANQHAKLAVILENPDEAKIKNLDTGEERDARYAVNVGFNEDGSLMRALYQELGRMSEFEGRKNQ